MNNYQLQYLQLTLFRYAVSFEVRLYVKSQTQIESKSLH